MYPRALLHLCTWRCGWSGKPAYIRILVYSYDYEMFNTQTFPRRAECILVRYSTCVRGGVAGVANPRTFVYSSIAMTMRRNPLHQVAPLHVCTLYLHTCLGYRNGCSCNYKDMHMHAICYTENIYTRSVHH